MAAWQPAPFTVQNLVPWVTTHSGFVHPCIYLIWIKFPLCRF